MDDWAEEYAIGQLACPQPVPSAFTGHFSDLALLLLCLIQGLKSMAQSHNSGEEARTLGTIFICPFSRVQAFLDPHQLLLPERCSLCFFFRLLKAGASLCYTDLVTLFSQGLQLHYKHFAHLRLKPVDENSFLMFAVVWKNSAFTQQKAVMMKGKILFSTLLPQHISKMRQWGFICSLLQSKSRHI